MKDKLNKIHLARQQAKQLLKLSKHAVETAIEQGEEVAMALLNKGYTQRGNKLNFKLMK